MTNLRGPDQRYRFAGATVSEILPSITGDVTVSFGVLSYAGTLVVVIVADPERHPDLDALATMLQAELDSLARAAGTSRRAELAR